MALYKTYSSGLTIKSPLPGTTGYFSTMDTDTWQKISEHDHTGSGKGNKLTANAISANAINGSSFRLDNDTWLRGRNAAGSADLNLVKVSPADELRFANAGANTRADLGLAIGTNVQAYDADLTTLGSGGAGARSFLGLGTGDSPTLTGITLTNAAIANLTATLSTFTGTINLSGLTASRSLATDGSKNVISGQDLSSTASPTFAGLTIANAAIANLTATNVAAFTATGDISFANTKGPVLPITTSISAAGLDQSGATAITNTVNEVTTSVPGAGVRLPSATAGRMIFVFNSNGTADSVKIYPASGEALRLNGTNNSITVNNLDAVLFIGVASGVWAYFLGT